MKIKKYIITRNLDYWLISIGGRANKRESSTAIYNIVERQLLKSKFNKKIAIIVNYGLDEIGMLRNESASTFDRTSLLYSLLCFLEDYLPKDFIRRKQKKYKPK